MQIILRGPAAGYEAEHTARLFFPGAEKADTLPLENDFVLAQSHLCTDSILLRYNGKMQWRTQLRPQGQTRSTRYANYYTACSARPPVPRRPGA